MPHVIRVDEIGLPRADLGDLRILSLKKEWVVGDR